MNNEQFWRRALHGWQLQVVEKQRPYAVGWSYS